MNNPSDSEPELEDFDPLQKSATLRKLMPTLTPTREKELRDIARNPKRPENQRTCCGSSCDPCVKTLYGQELRIWKECRKEGAPLKEIAVPADSPRSARTAPSKPAVEEPAPAKETVVRLWSW
ncbi:hypothetical protein HDU81_010575 [Chytriomyces hyalinus]|nr:hypothetical protein HDU81_010575 [Chytriomyces hyalinus]